jgi:hypothetical protein
MYYGLTYCNLYNINYYDYNLYHLIELHYVCLNFQKKNYKILIHILYKSHLPLCSIKVFRFILAIES